MYMHRFGDGHYIACHVEGCIVMGQYNIQQHWVLRLNRFYQTNVYDVLKHLCAFLSLNAVVKQIKLKCLADSNAIDEPVNTC